MLEQLLHIVNPFIGDFMATVCDINGVIFFSSIKFIVKQEFK